MMYLGILSVLLVLLGREISGFRSLLKAFPSQRIVTRSGLAMTSHEVSTRLSGKKLLIVQNKGGGHGSLGYYLTENLLKYNEELKVSSKPPVHFTIWQEKTNFQKSPFKETIELQSKSSNIFSIDSSALNPDSKPDSVDSFDFVIDNWSKSAQNVSQILDSRRSKGIPSQYVFISSAGMYQQEELYPLTEVAKVKDSNDVRKTELAILDQLKRPELSSIKYTFLRPQYLYGSKSSKNYLSYFIGRVVRDRPVPVPLSGDQLVCLTHQQDAASFILAAIGNPKAQNQIFNLGTHRYISYKGIVELIHKAVNPDATKTKFVHYDPLHYPNWKSSNSNALFPFRRDTFITSVSKGVELLHWKPQYSIQNELPKLVKEYIQSEESKKQWGDDELKFDNEVLVVLIFTFSLIYLIFLFLLIHSFSQKLRFNRRESGFFRISRSFRYKICNFVNYLVRLERIIFDEISFNNLLATKPVTSRISLVGLYSTISAPMILPSKSAFGQR